MKFLGSVLLSFLFLGCITQKNNLDKTSSRFLFVGGFMAQDLSEDAHHLSTKNDEVIMVYGSLFTNSHGNIVRTELNTTLIEEVTKNTYYPLDTTLFSSYTVDSLDEYYFIGLLEFDDELSQRHATEIKTNFKNSIAYKSILETRNSWNEEVKKQNHNNDNLGIVFQKKEFISTDLTISGQHLDDKYMYLFKSHFNSQEE